MARCGTVSAYIDGCHCERCREAAKLRYRRIRAAQRRYDPRCSFPCILCNDWFRTTAGRDQHETKVHR